MEQDFLMKHRITKELAIKLNRLGLNPQKGIYQYNVSELLCIMPHKISGRSPFGCPIYLKEEVFRTKFFKKEYHVYYDRISNVYVNENKAQAFGELLVDLLETKIFSLHHRASAFMK